MVAPVPDGGLMVGQVVLHFAYAGHTLGRDPEAVLSGPASLPGVRMTILALLQRSADPRVASCSDGTTRNPEWKTPHRGQGRPIS